MRARPRFSVYISRLLALFAVFFPALVPAALPDRPTPKELSQGFRERTLLAQPRASHRATAAADEARERVHVRAKFSHLGDLRVIELGDADPETVTAAVARLTATGRYEFVELDRLRRLDATPADPSFSTQWPLANAGQSGGIPGADIKALAAWDLLHDAPNVIVAVLDTGVNLRHLDLAPNLWRNPSPTSFNDLNGASFVGGNGVMVSGNPTDDVGHGTHVAGIIGAAANNNVATAGVAWKVQLMPVKVLASDGGFTSDIAAGINYAIAHGAHVINASFGDSRGTAGFSQTELAAITAARDAGVIFVASAGNDTTNLDVSRHYPSSFALDNIVTVGSTTRNDTLAGTSNYGTAVDLLAPGDSIVSLGYATTTGTATLSGTSMAAPHVSGALALLKARFPSDTYRQLINRLLRGADVIPRYAGKSQNGGRLNLLNALTTTTNRPFNDDFATRARLAGGNFSVRSSNVGATAESGEPVSFAGPGGTSLWWEWTPTTTAAVRLTTTGSDYDTILSLYTGTVLSSLTLVASNDNAGTGVTSRVDFTVQAGVTYQISVDGKNAATGLTLLTVGSVPANDAFASPVALNGLSDGVTATNANCTRETGEPGILGFAGGTSLWYRWTAPRSGRFQFAAVSSDFDPLLAIYTGTGLSALTLVAASDNSGPASSQTSSLCPIEAVAGTTYLITVDSKSISTVGTFTLTVSDALWQSDTGGIALAGAALTGGPAVALDGSIYIGSTDRALYAFAPDGALKWRFATAGLIDTCSPAIADDGTVYIGSNDGLLYALRPDGTLKWSHNFNTPTDVFSAGNSPTLAVDGTIYVKVDDGYLYALAPADGATKWRTNVNAPATYASATVAPDGTIYQGSDDRKLYALNPANGAIKWSYTTDNEIYTTPALDAAGNLYFGVANSGRFYSLTPAGTLRWVYTGSTIATTSSPVLSADGSIVYFGAYDKKLHAVSTATGVARWTYLLGDEVRACTPALDSKGVIYIGCYDFKLYAINPDGSLNRTWSTGNWIRSSPAVVGHRLYVGSNDNKLYAFDLGAAGAGTGPWPQYRHNPRRLGRAVAPNAFPPDSRLLNLSVRTTAGTAAQTLTVGFVIGPGTAKPLLVRGIGPGLTPFGVTGALADPLLQLYAAGSAPPLATNDNWGGSASLATAFASVGAFSLPPASLDSALHLNLPAGGYTAQIASATAGVTGIALAELYDADPTPSNAQTLVAVSRLTNVSARALVGTDANLLIAGFTVGGLGSKTLLIRAIGPGLAPFGVPNLLANPKLELFSGTQKTNENDDWGGTRELTDTFALVGAFSLPASSGDAVLLVTLQPGSYTAQVSGASNTTGVALVELYEVP